MKSIQAAFDLMGWQGEAIPERHAIRSIFNGRETSYQTFVMRLPGEGLYRFVILCPIEVPRQNLGVVGEFLHRINATLPLGAFELDFERLAIRWVGSVESMGDAIPAPWIGSSLQRGLTSFETVWPELIAVCEGRLAAQAAELRCQLAMELPQLNAAFNEQGLTLSLTSIEEDGNLAVLVEGGPLEPVQKSLHELFGENLPFDVRAN